MIIQNNWPEFIVVLHRTLEALKWDPFFLLWCWKHQTLSGNSYFIGMASSSPPSNGDYTISSSWACPCLNFFYLLPDCLPWIPWGKSCSWFYWCCASMVDMKCMRHESHFSALEAHRSTKTVWNRPEVNIYRKITGIGNKNCSKFRQFLMVKTDRLHFFRISICHLCELS